MRDSRVADGLYGGALITLSLVGVGVVRVLTGHDLGAGFQPAYLLLAGAWIWRLGHLASDRRGEFVRTAWSDSDHRWVFLGGIAIIAVILVSGVGLRIAPAPVVPHEAIPRFAKQGLQLLIMMAFLAYPALWTRGAHRWRWTMRLLAVTMLVQIIYAPLQAMYATGALNWLEPLDRLVTSNPAIHSHSDRVYVGGFTEIPRLRGTMGEPLYLGNLLVALVLLAMASRRRILAAAGTLMLIATWSRGAWMALPFGLVVLLALRWRAGLPGPPRRLLAITAAAAAVGLAVATIFIGPDTVTLPIRRMVQIFDMGDWSNLTRLYSVQAAWRAFQLSPLVGVGWGQFPYHFYGLVDVSGLQSQFTWPVVNNIPVLILCETGILGVIVSGVLVTGLWRATWRALPQGSPQGREWLATTAAASAALGMQLLVFSQYNLPHLWVVPGLWLAALVEQRRPSSSVEVAA